MQLFKTKRPAGWVDLMTGFESRKRGTGPYRRTSTMVSLPFSFMEFFKRRKVSRIGLAKFCPIMTSNMINDTNLVSR